jgi:hypothetical protein
MNGQVFSASLFFYASLFSKKHATAVLVVDYFIHGFAAALGSLLHVPFLFARAGELVVRPHPATAPYALK